MNTFIKKLTILTLLILLTVSSFAAKKISCEESKEVLKIGEYLNDKYNFDSKSKSQRDKIHADLVKQIEANAKTAKGGHNSWLDVIPDNGGSSQGRVFDKYKKVAAGEVFYRTISAGDYKELLRTGRMPVTDGSGNEMSTSPNQSFSDGYKGVTIKFYVAHGTIDKFKTIGVRDQSDFAIDKLGEDMPESPPGGWLKNHVRFKTEGGKLDQRINIQLGTGKGLDIFNDNLVAFEVLRNE